MAIADRELKDIGGSLKGKVSNASVIQHALLATEAMLKAIIWKREGWARWPKKTKKNRYLYYHDLEAMLENTGQRDKFLSDDERAASWRTLVNAGAKQFRYSPSSIPNSVAWSVARSARHPDWGVIPWLRQVYRTMI